MAVMSSAAADRSASARSEATRKRVVEAAIACVAEEGFQASNLSRIARYAGMTTGAIQHQFGDKAALLAEVYGDGLWRYHKTTAKNSDGTPMRNKEELAHLEGLDVLREQFPIYNNRNSPRIIALALENARAARLAGTNAQVSATTNAPPPATGEIQPSAR